MRHWKVVRSRDYDPPGLIEYGRAYVVRRIDGAAGDRQISIEFVVGGDEDVAATRVRKFLERPEPPPRRIVVDGRGKEAVLEP